MAATSIWRRPRRIRSARRRAPTRWSSMARIRVAVKAYRAVARGEILRTGVRFDDKLSSLAVGNPRPRVDKRERHVDSRRRAVERASEVVGRAWMARTA